MKNLGLVPLKNFGIVDPVNGIYRSAQPEYFYEYDYIKEFLGVDTIINLRAESRHDNKFTGLGFEVINIDVKDHYPPTIKQARDFIKLVKSKKGKILFHCEHGHGRTSTFCILARIAMGWGLKAAIAEEENKFHYRFRHAHQLEFLEKYFK